MGHEPVCYLEHPGSSVEDQPAPPAEWPTPRTTGRWPFGMNAGTPLLLTPDGNSMGQTTPNIRVVNPGAIHASGFNATATRVVNPGDIEEKMAPRHSPAQEPRADRAQAALPPRGLPGRKGPTRHPQGEERGAASFATTWPSGRRVTGTTSFSSQECVGITNQDQHGCNLSCRSNSPSRGIGCCPTTLGISLTPADCARFPMFPWIPRRPAAGIWHFSRDWAAPPASRRRYSCSIGTALTS